MVSILLKILNKYTIGIHSTRGMPQEQDYPALGPSPHQSEYPSRCNSGWCS